MPGFEAPTLLAYSARNRSASCRIPFTTGPNGKRVEVRFPDPSSNPYLAFAAMLMAGLDGIRNRIDPGDPLDKNLYDLDPEERSGIATLSSSLKEAVDSLESDHNFLTEGGVFAKDAIEGYIELRREEIQRLDYSPHPAEFDMYYSV